MVDGADTSVEVGCVVVAAAVVVLDCVFPNDFEVALDNCDVSDATVV